MDFPDFENINEDHNRASQNHAFGDKNEIEIENMEFGNNNYNNYQNFNENYIPGQDQNANFNNMPWDNTVSNQMGYDQSQMEDGLDEVERKRIEERKAEEEQRRAKLMKKMNDELRIKQEFRDKAREYIENWRE